MISKKRMFEIFEKFSKSKVLVIGDLMVDHFICGHVSRISPEAPVPVVEVTSESYHLGGSSNVINNIYSMGGKVHVAGVVGEDLAGKWLLEEISKIVCDIHGIIVDTERPTTKKTRIVAHSQQVVRYDKENRDEISSEVENYIVDYIKTKLREIGAIVISDYNKGVVTKSLIYKIKQLLFETNSKVIVCVDPKKKEFDIYQNFDVITPNHIEMEQAVGREIRKEEDMILAGNLLMNRYGFKALLVTRGEKGMTLFEQEKKPVTIPTVAQEVYDVTGAGDTAIGVFALSMASGATFSEAAVLANHAAGIVVGKIGTATATKDEMERFFYKLKRG